MASIFFKGWLIHFLVCLIIAISSKNMAQVSYGGSAIYSLRKVNPSYSGAAINIRRSCDNSTRNIDFTSCGDLDTITLRTFVLGYNPLSSITTTAAAAFSLRKLNCSYAGSAITIRRSSDNATQNIGFTSTGDLDTVAMKAFVGANSAFVTTWFDQSGNGRNALQAIAANQPRIMNAGVIEYQNRRPAIRWLGMGYALSTAGFTGYSSAACFNAVAKVNVDLSFNTTVNKCNNNYPCPLDFYNATYLSGNGVGANFFAYGATFNASKPLGIWTYQGQSSGAVSSYYNSSLVSSTSGSAIWSDLGNPLVLGSRADLLTGLNGWISEVITWGTLPTNNERNFVEWTQGDYYGITGPALTSIPAGAPNAFINTWYDQSGNGNDLFQIFNVRQPQIVSTGRITRVNNIPAVYFDGTKHLIESNLICSPPYFATTMASRTGAPLAGSLGFARLLNLSSTLDQYGFIGTYGGGPVAGTPNFATFVGIGSSWNDMLANSPATAVGAASSIMSMNVATGAGNLIPYMNGNALTGKNGTSASSTGFTYGGAYNNNNFSQRWTGYSYGLEIFTSAISQTRRILLETNQSAYYNITISNSKYTPPATNSYQRFVLGIGRESVSDSVNATRTSVGMGIATGTNATDYLKDNGDYITAGIDCAITPTVSLLNLPGSVVARWFNDWYITKTDIGGNNGNLSFYFDFSDYGFSGAPGVAANYVLLKRPNTSANFAIVASVTPSVVGDRISFLVDASNINNNYYYTIGTTNASASPLPVELFEFTASKIENGVNLNWKTMTEINSDYYTVQRSEDAMTFSDIGNVKAKGNSNVKLLYNFTDSKALKNTSYYRLKLVDIDKTSKYSNIIAIQFEESVLPIIYPNPSNGNLKVENCISYNKILISDVLGNIVYTETINQNNIDINLTHLKNGCYFISLTQMNSTNKFITKIILSKNN